MQASFLRRSLFSALAVLFLALAGAAPSHAQICSNASLRGSFGYTVTGQVTASNPPFVAGPFGAVGRLVFDGAGNVSTTRTFSDAGFVVQGDKGTGTYKLNSDCTGSFNISVDSPGSGSVILRLDIVLDGDYELRGIVTNPGFVLTLHGRKLYSPIY